ncbi:phytoene desaturase family protein [Chitinophaga japonensis]|uniref:All-trans-retinol 13,14-reductase n=1 Tax=Chitinophaga japonensis TaxID=104662 RepID=A0A562T5T7_CHIJA|nr:NAD(P)/FAD-dependent oxidoreductase [Chitinophaga japonensis]TWI88370.1 all-trans-retinol 13,14-reductase [Chitinophaga japonensis]
MNYDIAIIGSGLGGLVCGAMLSRNGYRVAIFEKNKQIGGSLQTYARNKAIIDSGVHYIGGLGEGRTLNRIFRYLGIIDKLKLQRLDMDGFDHIAFAGHEKVYRLAQGYDNFIGQLLKEFPGERSALEAYCHTMKDVCSRFPLYNLRTGSYAEKQEVLNINASGFFRQLTSDERLQQVLAGNNLLYAGVPDKTPFYVHALVVNSYIEDAWKCVDGGSQIGKWLARGIMEKGGVIFRNTAVRQIIGEGNRVDHIVLDNGQQVRATHYISNLHPTQTMDMTESELIRSAYRSRISTLENAIAPFVLNIVLKPGTFPYLNYNYYYHQTDDAWAGTSYREDNWPLTYGLFASASSRHMPYTDSLSVLTYMHYREVGPWQHTFNTTSLEQPRGADYDAFKRRKAERLLDVVEQRFPGLRNCIDTCYTATPLSFRDYLGTADGSMYGVQKDYKDALKTMITHRTKLSNLYLTGQNLNLHGILGVTISAVMTCGEILGLDWLVEEINKK